MIMDLSFGSEEKAPTPSPQSTSAESRRRGKSLLAQGRYREAREAFAEALALNPEEAKAWCSLGEANERLGRIDVALHIYREGLRQVSGSRHLLYVRIARLHVRRGEFEPARRALTKALALRPDDAMLAEMLARVRARLLHSPAVETEQDEPDLPPPAPRAST